MTVSRGTICEFCNGSRWILSTRELGPCICAPKVTLLVGDNRPHLRVMVADSVDAVICDPPYGLSKEPDMVEVLRHWLAGDDYTHDGAGFMGKTWDSFVPGPGVWREVFRVLKPGGHLVAFFGSRTYDMGVLAIRLAGFEIRDQIGWVYGSGFPKSHNVAKAIDASLGLERELTRPGVVTRAGYGEDWDTGTSESRPRYDNPASPEAAEWEGWGTALKPAIEPVVIARKPLSEGSVAANVQRWGTGALNIDRCRVEGEAWGSSGTVAGRESVSAYGDGLNNPGRSGSRAQGRWPANLVHDGSDEAVAEFPETTSGGYPPEGGQRTQVSTYGKPTVRGVASFGSSSGSAARFFYCAKASTSDREDGLAAMTKSQSEWFQTGNGASGKPSSIAANRPPRMPRTNNHPTVKPTDLMRWLCRLVTPPGGVVLDPFMGSGSTGRGAVKEGFDFIGIELDPEYVAIARARIEAAR